MFRIRGNIYFLGGKMFNKRTVIGKNTEVSTVVNKQQILTAKNSYFTR